jgi:hypothetical protein
MGGYIEINDTLQITTEQGFPEKILNLEKHQKNPIILDEVKDKVFEFYDKPNARIYQVSPTRNFLVHNIDGKWLFWGKILIIEQNIKSEGEKHVTSGKYKIIKIYDPEYQKQITVNESDSSYF